jgi:hypothetical protein
VLGTAAAPMVASATSVNMIFRNIVSGSSERPSPWDTFPPALWVKFMETGR